MAATFRRREHGCQAALPLVAIRHAHHTWRMRRARLETRYIDRESLHPRARVCDQPGCREAGEHRAPQGRDRLDQYYWFCLDHVRAYNAAWNYYAGMTIDEIEAENRKDMVGRRPTWPLGARFGRLDWKLRDAFGVFDVDDEPVRERRRPLTIEEQAMAVFEIEPGFTLVSLKARYKELVKLHHPDANGGDKAAEEKLKVINQAYSTLKASLKK